jgi:hypothetical protein
MLDESAYAGHYNLPLDPSHKSERERRGKYRANKRQPRVSSAVDTTDTVSYFIDEDGRKVRGRRFRSFQGTTVSRERDRRRPMESRLTATRVQPISTTTINHRHNFND